MKNPRAIFGRHGFPGKGHPGWGQKGFSAELVGTCCVTTVAATVPGPIVGGGGLNSGLRLELGVCCPEFHAARSSTRLTCMADHSPLRGVSIRRAFSSAAMARRDNMPAACRLTITGRMLAAKA